MVQLCHGERMPPDCSGALKRSLTDEPEIILESLRGEVEEAGRVQEEGEDEGTVKFCWTMCGKNSASCSASSLILADSQTFHSTSPSIRAAPLSSPQEPHPPTEVTTVISAELPSLAPSPAAHSCQ
ncbi:hypothetical protein CHARACLAT_032185 [Characodon lateralis]|uniref:Uncharacterized protein n=1 Tax=Characodon lateralis TaxID=208331 RepID=A0ABU7DBV5_9TELE|nr:hypothetical protein [Characodon lateralis]